MPSLYLVEKPEKSTLILPHTTASLEPWLAKQDEAIRTWVRTNEFTAKPQTHLRVPAEDGGLDYVLAGIDEKSDLWSLAGLPASLPEGVYHIDSSYTPPLSRHLALGWLLGCYEFSAYKKEPRKFAALALPAGCDAEELLSQVEAIALVRDLINTPAEDMGPTALADAAQRLAKTYGASCKILSGSALLKHNYPAIHAVGRASDEDPCLVDIHWGNPKAPKVTLVGKGVCFDSGGLDIKTAAGMELMKKDMGGAAHVLGLARMLMDARLNIRLRVLIPAVENSISGNAFRPGDVLRTRKGLTVEIGNTDAEGRLILCDALTEADSEKPDLLIDCATLTGAARVGLGTDVPAIFSRNDSLAKKLVHIALGMNDPLWQLPLWHGYRDQLDSGIADLNNSPSGGYGGAITAALFLNEFVTDTTNWIHVDMMAWNVKPLPGRPKGGEAMGLRALFALISEKFSA